MAGNAENLIQVYLKRPDLQALYKPSGEAVNPKDPKVAGIPTLLDWAKQFGSKEEASLKEFAPAAPVTTPEFDPVANGIPLDVWNSLTPGDKAFAESTAGLLRKQYDQGQTNVSINQDLLNKALQAAQTDPNIISKYGDAAKAAASDVQFNLGQINANYATQQNQQQLEMAKQKKDLEDQLADAGQAYSGFRKQAENMLGSQQANIIQSTRSQLQQNLQNLGRNYEQTYGSDALYGLGIPFTAGGIGYQPLQGIKGSAPIAKQQEIESRQAQIFNNEALTK